MQRFVIYRVHALTDGQPKTMPLQKVGVVPSKNVRGKNVYINFVRFIDDLET